MLEIGESGKVIFGDRAIAPQKIRIIPVEY